MPGKMPPFPSFPCTSFDTPEIYRMLIENIREGVFIIQDARLCLVNEAFAGMIGYTVDEIIGKQFSELVAPEDVKLVTERYWKRSLQQEDVPKQYEFRMIHKDQTQRVFVHMTVDIMRYRNGLVSIGTVQNITDQKQKDEALLQSEERLTLALDATSDALWDWDLPSGKAYFSPRYYTMLGYEPGEFPADYEAWVRLLHPEDKAETIRRIRQHIENNSDSYSEEFRLCTKSGHWRWILGRGKVITRDENGMPVRMVGTHVDIDRRKCIEEELKQYRDHLETLVRQRTEELERTNERLVQEVDERKQAQTERENALQELKTTSSLLQAVFDAIPDVIGVQDNDHRMLKYNAAGYRFLSMKPEDVLGRRCFELIGRHRECDICATSKVYESKRPAQVERYEEALQSWLDVRAYPILDENDNVVNVIEHLRDITADKNAEVEKRRLYEKLQHAQKMEAIGTLAGGIAHDFNNLLMGILGNASILLADTGPDRPEYEKIKSIEQFAINGADLTKQLLGIGRGGRYEVKATDLRDLIGNTVQMFGRTKKDIQIHQASDPDLWPVSVDQTQINQVVLNILVNSAQAMPAGGSIHIGLHNVELDPTFVSPFGVSAGRYIKVDISDTGIGIDPDMIQRIFDPFFTTKAKERGTGLGLASAYGIIQSHDGIITANSRKGNGTTLTFFLPATDDAVVKSIDPSPVEIKGKGNIMIVDDEAMILEVGCKMIGRLGYTVMTAGSGMEAISTLKRHHDQIDLVVLDMIMPGMGGEETFKKLKELQPNLKVLLASGYSITGKAKEILNQGCDGFIQKPFDLNELSRKLDEILA